MAELSPKQRKHLAGLAHGLSPVVQVGAAGISEGVLEALAVALAHHELIKVKLPKTESADARHQLASELAERGGATLVKLLGRVAILYLARDRDLPGKPRIKLG